MAKDYTFHRTLERQVDDIRDADPVIEGHYITICEEMRGIGNHPTYERDENETVKKVSWLVLGVLNNSDVEFGFKDRDKKQVRAKALVHVTGLFPMLNRQLAKRLDNLGYKLTSKR